MSDNGVRVDDCGIEGSVDSFGLCHSCNDLLQEMAPRRERWRDLESRLCPDWLVGFQAHALAVELFGIRRLFSGDIQARHIADDELAEEPVRGVAAACEDHSPEQEDV